MIKEGKRRMEKRVGEEDIKGLEEEIDSAVDRLFIDKKGSVTERLSTEPALSESSIDKKSSMAEKLSMESPILEASSEPVKATRRESSLHPSPEPTPPPYVICFEKMETQLLSLEWEITTENLEKTKEEVVALRKILKERPDINSVLNLMEKVLIHMIKNEEHIQPPQTKFLLDSKEAIKLLMKKETNSEINSYKQLVFGGIGARFLCLEGLKETRVKQPSSGAVEERDKTEMPKMWEQQIEGLLNKMKLFSEKLDEILKKFEYDLSRLGEKTRTSPEEFVERKLLPLNITIFKIDEKLFGIESQKVFKLFKLPNTYQDRISGHQRIRLKEFEIQMVDLKKIFPIESKGRKGLPAGRQGEIQILTVKENGEYKGLMVDQLLKKLSAEADISEDYGEYFLGMVHWIYQEKPVEIPILNLKKI